MWRPLNQASKLATGLTLAHNDCPVPAHVDIMQAQARMRALMGKVLNEPGMHGCAAADSLV